MTCKYCGELIKDNAKFCTACGASVDESAETPVGTLNPSHSHAENCAHESYSAGYSQMVTFLDAVKLFFTRYTDFRGRSRRSEYWWVCLFNLLVSIAISAIVPSLSWIWSVITLLPSVALTVRRFHDTGKSGWWVLMGFIPLAGPIIILIQLLKDSAPDNQWGPNPKY